MKHAFCFVLVLASPMFAGVRIQLDSTDLATGDVVKREIMLDAERLRMNETGKGINRSVLFLTDGGRNRMVMLDKDKNEYREIDQQTLEQTAGQANDAMAKMQAQMKNMTPEQRAMMEQMMKGRGMPGAASASVANAVKTVYTAKGPGSANGFSCTKYDGMRGAEKVSEVCAADPAALKYAAADFKVYEKMKEFSESMTKMVQQSPFFNANTASSITDAGFSGFPVQSTSFKNGKPSAKTDAKVIERASFGNADFSLGNAKKIELPTAPKGRK